MSKPATLKFTALKSTDALDLDGLNAILATGKSVVLRRIEDDTEVRRFRFPAAKDITFAPKVFVHGVPPRDIANVLDYIEGDAHDRSKVQWINGKFNDFFNDPNEAL
jgi:hypothetical protein